MQMQLQNIINNNKKNHEIFKFNIKVGEKTFKYKYFNDVIGKYKHRKLK